ncbi:MAG: hypothetical protein IJF02_03350 [Oscillospiraceae bacterium]|nr:hypothetical protein [Oscillospiraceae bacterium]
MKKFFPFILLVWPYLFFPAAYLKYADTETGIPWLLIFCILTPVVYIANIICAIRTNDTKFLARWNMVLKLCHIPVFLFIFIYGVAVALAVWAFLFFTPIILAILVIIDVLLLCTTSTYGICALVRTRLENRISMKFMAVNIIMHLLFVWDVISSIIVFFKLRKAKPAE